MTPQVPIVAAGFVEATFVLGASCKPDAAPTIQTVPRTVTARMAPRRWCTARRESRRRHSGIATSTASTIPAVATTLLGILTGHWLRSERAPMEKVVGMFVSGAVCVVLGWAWNPFFPINKSLWTSSYVLFTAGLALQFLSLCYWVIDIQGYRRWAWPFEVFGVNALALFVGTALMVRLMALLHVQGWIFRNLFLSWAQPINASLFYALAFILLWLFFMWLLYRKRIYIKV